MAEEALVREQETLSKVNKLLQKHKLLGTLVHKQNLTNILETQPNEYRKIIGGAGDVREILRD